MKEITMIFSYSRKPLIQTLLLYCLKYLYLAKYNNLCINAFRSQILNSYGPIYFWMMKAWKLFAKYDEGEHTCLHSTPLLTKDRVSAYLKMISILPIEESLASLSIAKKAENEI